MKIREDMDKRLGVVNWSVDTGAIAGRRLRRRFATQEQAEAWVQEIESIRQVEGQKTMELWARMGSPTLVRLIQAAKRRSTFPTTMRSTTNSGADLQSC